MASASEAPEVKEILDFLQTVYQYRLDPGLIPSSLKGSFARAVLRFQNPEELKKINRALVGIGEEVGDLAYQALKLICQGRDIMTEDTIKTLENHLTRNHFYDSDGKLVGLTYMDLDRLGRKVVGEELITNTCLLLPDSMFLPGPSIGRSIIREFLGGQFVAYISRQWRGHQAGGLQKIEYIRDRKIPEETRELIEAIIKSSEGMSGIDLMRELTQDVEMAANLMKGVEATRSYFDSEILLRALGGILRAKLPNPITVEETLSMMFCKMRGRQEMDFSGIDQITMRRTCFPVEFLIAADMFL